MFRKWRELNALLTEVIQNTSVTVEQLQKETAGGSLALFERLPVVSLGAKMIHRVHDAVVTSAHTAVRSLNRAVGGSVDAVLKRAAI